jgi:NAD(P)-dependent dehydrogenase (short-subunit alcohol dehydrogenase family)
MNSKIVVITGANSGIGKASATKFAAEGCHVIMACRNIEISKIAQQEIMSTSGNPYVDLMELDVSSFESIC